MDFITTYTKDEACGLKAFWIQNGGKAKVIALCDGFLVIIYSSTR